MKAALKIGEYLVTIEAINIEHCLRDESNTFEFLNDLSTILRDAAIYNQEHGYPTLEAICTEMDNDIFEYLCENEYYAEI